MVLKKNLIVLAIFVTLVFSSNGTIRAYEYVDKSNEDRVNNLINEIYDTKQQYEDLAGEYEDILVLNYATSDMYWWPIGSDETQEMNGHIFAVGQPAHVNISSPFSYRVDPFGRSNNSFHSGIDIPNGGKYNVTNIIASKSGIVVFPTSDIPNNCPSSSGLDYCGGSYGNYVIIQHNDGNYTLYGHLYEGSILVTAGDSVQQGQVIAKMGSSGASTGAHLHFEVREGSNAYSATVDPLTYVDPKNPRPAAASVVNGSDNMQTFCLTMKQIGYSDTAVIAIMRSIKNESGFNPMNLQNSYERSLGFSDESYTSAVDSGQYGNFIHDSAGYGLAQWTYWSRKQRLYDYAKSKNASIGDLGMQIELFVKELTENYPHVDNYLKDVSISYSDKAYYFCRYYENPAGNCFDRRDGAVEFESYVKNGCQ